MASFAETFSSLKSFETCPRQWSEVTFYKNFPFQRGTAAFEGEDVHKLIAEALSGGEPLPPGYGHVEKIIAPIQASGFTLLPEYKMAVDSNMNGVPYDSPNRLFRGDADLLAIDGARGVVIDWKNGSSKYPDKNQLDAMALLAFGAFPELQTVNGLIVFLQDKKTETKSMTRQQAPFVWKQWKDRIAAKQRAIASKNFAANPSGLCRGWCPVTTCSHYEAKKV
jgi:PD-(D/E)XK nuclease superfamily